MKKLLFMVLSIIIHVPISAADIYISKTLTVGVPLVIDSAHDLGFSYGAYRRLTTLYDDNLGKFKSYDYILSDPSAFALSIEQYSFSNYSTDFCYRYTLTPTTVGVYTFEETISGVCPSRSRYTEDYHIIYNITVVDLTSISLGSSELSLFLGDSYTFTPTLVDSRAETTLTWISSNTSVASIDENGVLTTVGLGTTTITCTAHNGRAATCVVTVSPVEVSNITLSRTEAELVAGEKVQLMPTVSPDNATNKTVTWSSTNEAVAVVSESGLVTAVGSGTCQVKATANDGSGKSASCLVTVLGDVLFCEDFGAVPGATVTLPIQLTNADAIQGFEFKLVLPEGVSVQTDGSGKPLATLTERISTQGLEGAYQGNGVYQFVFTSTARIQGNSGAVVNIPIVVADNVAVGQYDVIVKDVELVKYGISSQIHHSDRTATLTIKEKTLGDVNGDGRISVADAISIINYVLGRTPASFITVAADVNSDGDITLADAVATVDKILGGDNASARAFVRSIMALDPQ